ncbi:MAG: pilus assembly PilX N-terminal domain-containing protein [Candidatus Staskawiczbacteria bacterium]|nr:pilus assembly PilX N-terminal domain-containing protein [Candidatus Staskawiczbacteria bacterium]
MDKHTYRQRGVSLVITFFIMIIILSVVLSVSILLYSELKVIRNIGNSTVGFYAADSGIEKVLYYDKQVLVTTVACTGVGQGTCSTSGQICNNGFCTVPRGLCLMLSPSNANPCTTGSTGIYCNNRKPNTFNEGCDPAVCNNCTITFDTILDNATNNKYSVSATIFPTGNFEIDSKGIFGGAQRRIQTLIVPLQ